MKELHNERLDAEAQD